MSRRESRDSHGKRHSSRFDRDSSPKRSRREGKLAIEKTYSNSNNLEIMEPINSDQKHLRRFQGASPLEANPAPESKLRSGLVDKEMEKTADTISDGVKRSSDSTDVLRSRSCYQHDERGTAGQGGRNVGSRDTEKRSLGRWDAPREQSSDKVKEKPTTKDLQESEEKVSDARRRYKNQTRLDDGVWRHDKYHNLAADAPPIRRRPAFRENKLPADEHAPSAKELETLMPSYHERPGFSSSKRDERDGRLRGQERTEKTLAGADDGKSWEDRPLRWGGMRGADYHSRGARGRDRYNGRFVGERNQQQLGGSHVERWKHDLFDEANRSPTPTNEEDEIAKVEALLAS